MRILMVTPYLPFPPVSGGQTRSYHLIKRLAKRHSITLYCYYRKESEREYVQYLKPYVTEVHMIKRRAVLHPLHFLLSFFTSMPFLLVSTYYSPTLKKLIANELATNEYDLIHCETFYVSPNVPETRLPIILVEQTVEYHVYEHFVRKLPSFLRFILRFELLKLLNWEKRTWQRANRIVTVSVEDASAVIDLDPRQKNKLDIVPNGTAVEDFHIKRKPFKAKHPVICYVGNFKWLQNKEALWYLLNKIYPILVQDIPNAKFVVAGKHIPKDAIRHYTKVEFFESVQYIQEIYNKADILIAPLFGPGGTRLKILESMASGVLVATTTVGAMGLNLVDMKDVLLFENPQQLRKKLNDVIAHPALMRNIVDAAFKKVSSEFDWNAIVRKLEKNYEIALKS